MNGNPELRAAKRTMTIEVLRSVDTASKYHQSKDVLLTPDSLGPSKPNCEDTKSATASPIDTCEGIVLIEAKPFLLRDAKGVIAETVIAVTRARKSLIMSFIFILR